MRFVRSLKLASVVANTMQAEFSSYIVEETREVVEMLSGLYCFVREISGRDVVWLVLFCERDKAVCINVCSLW